MAYRIRGVIRLDDSGNANLGIATATEFDGKVSEKAITEQTDGSAGDVTGADELLLYDNDTGNLLRVTVDEFVGGSGIGTVVADFDNLYVTGITTLAAGGNGEITISEILGDPVIEKSGGGSLLIRSNNNTDIRGASNTVIARLGDAGGIDPGDGASLYHDGNVKLQTTNTGLVVTGILTSTNLSAASSVTAANYYGSGANLTGVATALGNLSDVDLTGLQDGEVIVYDQLNDEWVPGVGPTFTVDSNNNVYAAELIGTPNFTTGANNTVVGTNAGTNIDTGSENVIFGNAAGQQLTDGSDNVILGTSAANALSASTQADSNVVIGNSALLNATDAIGNVSIGAYVMSTADDFSRNVVLGNFALRGAGGSTGIQNNVVMGQQAAENAVSTLANPVTDNLIFGAYAAQNINNAEFNAIIGNNAGQFIGSGSDSNVLIGPNAGRDLLGVCNVAIGRGALAMLATGSGKGGDNNIAIGSYSLLNNFSGDFNIAIGLRAGQYLDNGINNVLTGACAGRSLTNGSGNTFYGLQAGDAATSANANAFFGDQAGRRIVTGVQNTLIGSGAAVNMTAGSYNNIVGSNTATGLSNANDNNVMGMFSLGGVTTGNYNTVFGNVAGNCITGSSSRNIIIGSRAVTTGASGVSNDNLVIGYDVQMPVGDGQMHIGNGTNRWITGDSSFNVNIPNDLAVGGTLLAADIFGVPIRSEAATIIGANTQQTLRTIDMTTLSKVEFILSIRTTGNGGGEKLIDSAAFYYDGTTITAAVPYASKAVNVFFNGDINTNPADMQIRYAISGAFLSIDLNDTTGGPSANPQFEWTLTITEAV